MDRMGINFKELERKEEVKGCSGGSMDDTNKTYETHKIGKYIHIRDVDAQRRRDRKKREVRNGRGSYKKKTYEIYKATEETHSTEEQNRKKREVRNGRGSYKKKTYEIYKTTEETHKMEKKEKTQEEQTNETSRINKMDNARYAYRRRDV